MSIEIKTISETPNGDVKLTREMYGNHICYNVGDLRLSRVFTDFGEWCSDGLDFKKEYHSKNKQEAIERAESIAFKIWLHITGIELSNKKKKCSSKIGLEIKNHVKTHGNMHQG